MKTWSKNVAIKRACNNGLTIKGNQSNRPECNKKKQKKLGHRPVARIVSYWINNTLFLQM